MHHVTRDAHRKNAIRHAITRLALVTLLSGCDATPPLASQPVAQSATAPATTQPVTNLTPPGPVVKLSGEGWEMVVHPSIGRITSFSRPGGANLLWVNESPEAIGRNKEWIDWGGDKVWPSPQEQWPAALGRKWPPGAAYEGGKWTMLVPHDKAAPRNARRFVSEPVQEIGVKIERSIEHAAPGWVHVDTSITRTERREVDTHIWNVTQVRVPEFAILSKGDLSFSQDAPLVRFRDAAIDTQEIALPEKGRSCVVVRPSSVAGKIGTMGRWVAAVYPDVIFVQVIDQARPGRYADRSSVQVFQSSTNWELETLGRSDKLDVGATRALRVRWGLLDRMAGEEMPDMVKRIQNAVEAK
jgi:hypothetical protein